MNSLIVVSLNQGQFCVQSIVPLQKIKSVFKNKNIRICKQGYFASDGTYLKNYLTIAKIIFMYFFEKNLKLICFFIQISNNDCCNSLNTKTTASLGDDSLNKAISYYILKYPYHVQFIFEICFHLVYISDISSYLIKYVL